MTLRLRNAIMFLLAIFTLWAPVFIVSRFFSNELTLNLQTIQEVLPILILSVFSTAACISIFLSFRNTASPEIFFFYIFIFSFIFDSVKLFDFNLYGMLATRIVYYGKFLGAMAVFSAGLFTTGIEYRRMEITAVTIFTLPAALVFVLPVDITSAIPGGTFAIGGFAEITVALIVLNLMGILNFIVAGIKNENNVYRIIGIGILLALAGREILFYWSGFYLSAAGFIILLGGTLITNLQTHSIYLWD